MLLKTTNWHGYGEQPTYSLPECTKDILDRSSYHIGQLEALEGTIEFHAEFLGKLVELIHQLKPLTQAEISNLFDNRFEIAEPKE